MIGYVTGWTPEKIEEIRKDPYFAPHLAAVRKTAEEMLATEPKRLKFSDMHLYVTTGNRSTYEKVYNDYTHRLTTYLFMYVVDNDDKYVEPLADIIWNICDIETWGLPAHVMEYYDVQRRRTFLELCSCNVGRLFGEVLACMEDKLPELVVRRMKQQVRERIIESYKNDHFGWMDGTNNWGAVCTAGVFASYVYFATEEEINDQLPKMLKTMDLYLSGFDSEGCCMEGLAYWDYGFSYFCFFADMLRNYTKGKINYFENERVHAIAKFQENCVINDRQCISFSDCGGGYNPSARLLHFLKHEYPDIQFPSIPPVSNNDSNIRAFVWVDPKLAVSEMRPESRIYHDAQWFIYRSDEYNFACKAGHNNEPHNHNDVGSFLISKDGKVTFTDAGTGEYTRQYFSNERYSILVTSGRGHSLPIINGEYQDCTKTKSTIYTENEHEYEFSMENAYTVESLSSLKRHFVCEADGISLTDTYSFAEEPSSVVERFVTLVEPTLDNNGKVYCGATVLEYDPKQFTASVSSELCHRHGGRTEPLYLVDLTPKSLGKNMTLSFKFV